MFWLNLWYKICGSRLKKESESRVGDNSDPSLIIADHQSIRFAAGIQPISSSASCTEFYLAIQTVRY
ncbi:MULTISPECIES: hypothetical protein [Okeania]|uniref:hypothetical protein n=1 Tax=Okeania TaxID=1458928 RepID=UPI000F53E7AA|nr:MULTISPECIES: hypothetical protein [Okeania]NEP06828.1 hypothetical protein [Okeania sp. SIO4D6]NEP38550.1 hypothetical protein [Okeania sp. SIO2H7]NET16936.1 hypothetical protein [Okeania sp. SIO1H6]NET18171.1 hypothetical protein [Okeania sp. SIO1H5]NEP72757.1 hypothetical protein [Okeania sp. SIO2G5]